MTGFGLGRIMILPKEKYDEKKWNYQDLKGKPITIKTGPKSKPIEIGYINDIFLNPREGLLADVVLAAEIEIEVDDDKNLIGVFMKPGPS